MNCFCKKCKEDESLFKWIQAKYPDKYIMFVHIKSNKKWLKYLPTGTFYGAKNTIIRDIYPEEYEIFHTSSIPIWYSLKASIETGHAVGISYIWTGGVYEIVKVY